MLHQICFVSYCSTGRFVSYCSAGRFVSYCSTGLLCQLLFYRSAPSATILLRCYYYYSYYSTWNPSKIDSIVVAAKAPGRSISSLLIRMAYEDVPA